MTTHPRFLFDNLPPELRLEVYSHLSTPYPTTPACTAGLPLKLKTFSCKHTTVQICPVHYGAKNLLALQAYGFQEAREYSPWLLNNAIELRIGVRFHGRINTFVQADWDKKMAAHLRKLPKAFPWLRKVAKYDVQLVWSPVDGVLRSRGNKRTAGRVVRDIVGTLMGLMDGEVGRKKGCVKVKLRLAHDVALETVRCGTRFGFGELLAGWGEFKRWEVGLWKEAHAEKMFETNARLIPVPTLKKEDMSLLRVERGEVTWAHTAQQLVVRKHISEDGRTELVAHEEKSDPDLGYIVASLVGECLGLS
ncbi:hypothetical protein EK21DRAFT_61208 [Setomelanomma holmii]|uniref:Uncharacterized protein n=1 Tax=Setomelanomma holmii TaxID=210430 RepID=A0A9P4HEQ9_9PLEO|nr:hypothetical protein EK21DRAFT_61208 [Setomelanomma holmii]